MAYRKPPITEAIIELRFKEQFEQKAIERIAKALSKDYVFDEVLQQVNVTVQPDGAMIENRSSGMKLSSLDRTDIVLLNPQSFACSRLAPYDGWEDFSERANKAFQKWRDVLGNRELVRIGVRYVNRIDIPIDASGVLNPRTYLRVWPESPDGLSEPMTGYTMQVVRPLGVDDCMLVLASANVPSPLVGFGSFLLDLDIASERNLPRRPEDIWTFLDKVRTHKNRIFEACMTEASRALFQ